MELSNKLKNIWKTRDELTPRNFRAALLPCALVLLLSIVIGDLRYLDQRLAVFGIDSNVLVQIAFGIGFLPIILLKERHTHLLLRMSVFAQAALLTAQLSMEPGYPRLLIYLAFHFANGVSTACALYLFAFALNNVERLFTMVAAKLCLGLTYLLFASEPVAALLQGIGSIAVMLAQVAVVFVIREKPAPAKQPSAKESLAKHGERESGARGSGARGSGARESRARESGARESGVSTIIALNMIFHIITLMTLYIVYKETTVSATLFGVGGLISVAVIFVVMLVFNYSAMHLWSLCLVCTVLGIGALHYTPAIAINGGSLFYGIGEGLGFVIIYYLMGGALKRSGSFKLLRLFCLFNFVNYAIINGVFFTLYDHLDAPNLSLAFPAILVLTLACLLVAPILHDKLFRTDWTDGYHMADMPLYAEALKQVEQLDIENKYGLSPREKDVCTLRLKSLSVRQISGELGIAFHTANNHYRSLYRKLNINSKGELFLLFGAQPPVDKAGS